MAEGYAAVVEADRRRAILTLLKENGGEAAESVLEKGLHLMGHRIGVTKDSVRKDLHWLRDCDLIEIDYFEGRVMIAAITTRGVNVQVGHERVMGVARPEIGR